jgi:hypothetical protein
MPQTQQYGNKPFMRQFWFPDDNHPAEREFDTIDQARGYARERSAELSGHIEVHAPSFDVPEIWKAGELKTGGDALLATSGHLIGA